MSMASDKSEEDLAEVLMDFLAHSSQAIEKKMNSTFVSYFPVNFCPGLFLSPLFPSPCSQAAVVGANRDKHHWYSGCITLFSVLFAREATSIGWFPSCCLSKKRSEETANCRYLDGYISSRDSALKLACCPV